MLTLFRSTLIRGPVGISRAHTYACGLPSTTTNPGAPYLFPACNRTPIRTMSSNSDAKGATGGPTPPVPRPRPSATVIVVNSQNEVLLVHRNPKSSSFANAHVGSARGLGDPVFIDLTCTLVCRSSLGEITTRSRTATTGYRSQPFARFSKSPVSSSSNPRAPAYLATRSWTRLARTFTPRSVFSTTS